MACRDAWDAFTHAELIRHLPMIAPVAELVWEHILETDITDMGTCCVASPERVQP